MIMPSKATSCCKIRTLTPLLHSSCNYDGRVGFERSANLWTLAPYPKRWEEKSTPRVCLCSLNSFQADMPIHVDRTLVAAGNLICRNLVSSSEKIRDARGIFDVRSPA